MTNPFSFRPRLRRSAAVIVAAALTASACTGADPQTQPDANGGSGTTVPNADLSSDDIVLTSGLTTVNSCDELLNRLTSEGSERVGPFGFGHGFDPFEGFEIAMEDEEAMAESAADAVETTADAGTANLRSGDTSADGDASSFSGTNNQEQQVDEADLVKTDGRRLVTLRENRMHVVDVSTDTPRLLNSIALPDGIWDGELFLRGDKAFLMTSGWVESPFLPASSGTEDSAVYNNGVAIGRLLQIDLERGELDRTLEFEGSYLSARRVDDTIRIVLTAPANRFPFLQPSNEGAAESATEFNRRLIEESSIEQWIPTYRITNGGPAVAADDPAIVTEGPIVDCDRVHLPQEFAGFGSVVVLTADLSADLDVADSVAVYTDASTVYASTNRLAVATPRWVDFDDDGRPVDDNDTYTTNVHTFDITDPARADYVASGSVIGHLLNQFSMSEHDGYLRVATTAGNPWETEEGGAPATESFVTVLAEDDGALKPIGQVGGLGEGEQIFAVRFLGDRGYVVTFRQIDPLYTLDLSDPANPTVEGELKIPGFSSYLHPLDDGLLLGVGMDGDDEGRITGAAVSLFDVADPANPTQLDKLLLADQVTDRSVEAHSFSPVNDDARAFNYFDDTAIIPVIWSKFTNDNGNDSEFGGQERSGSEAALIQVEDRSLVEVARVAHPSLEQCEGPNGLTTRLVELAPDGEVIPADGAAVPGGLNPDQGPASDDSAASDSAEASTDAEADFVTDIPDVAGEIETVPSTGPIEEYCWVQAPAITRTVVVDDTLYTVAHHGIGVHDFETGSFRQWIDFQR